MSHIIETTTTDLSTLHPTILTMIEECGERWLATKDRSTPQNEIVICLDPPRCFRLSNGYYQNTDGWVVSEGHLSMGEISLFVASFGLEWLAWIGSVLLAQYPVRAFIRDGADQWNFSLETKDSSLNESARKDS